MPEKLFSSFRLGEALFGMDILLVREINRNLEITPVEQAADFVLGVINLRGQIVTILDLGVRLGLPRRDFTNHSRCIVMKTASELAGIEGGKNYASFAPKDVVGVVVDQVGEVISIDASGIEKPPANINGVDSKFVQGMVKLDHDLMVVLNAREAFDMESETQQSIISE